MPRIPNPRITPRRVVCGLVIVSSSFNVLGMIGGYHGLNVVGGSDFVVVVPGIKNAGVHSVIHGVSGDCGIRSEVLKVDSALSVGHLRVTVVPGVTRTLLKSSVSERKWYVVPSYLARWWPAPVTMLRWLDCGRLLHENCMIAWVSRPEAGIMLDRGC